MHPRTINGVVYTTSLLSEALKAAGYRCGWNQAPSCSYTVRRPDGSLVETGYCSTAPNAWSAAAELDQRDGRIVLVDWRADVDGIAVVALDALETGRVATWNEALALVGGSP